MNVYIKSILYLAVFSGAGYVLSEVTTPSKEKIDLLKRQHREGNTLAVEERNKKALLMQKLKEASENSEPVYLKKKKNE